MKRAKRKLDHIEHALTTRPSLNTHFQDIRFVHRSLPETSHHKIELQTNVGELSLSSPIFINAMTGGGGEKTTEINEQLACAAKECNLAIAVGSQTAALKDPVQTKSFQIVRKVNPKGIVFANIGCEADIEMAKRAVHMLEADALQIHVNTIQELVMPEGDRDFSGWLENINNMKEAVNVPIIVKEVGFGMSRETAQSLQQMGITLFDIGGRGGTDFGKVENERRHDKKSFFNEWGISTPASIVEVSKVPNAVVLGSGGISTAMDVAKAIALGANATGMAGHLLAVLLNEGFEGLLQELTSLDEDLRYIMNALGTPTIAALQNSPLVICGNTFHWLQERGINTSQYAQR